MSDHYKLPCECGKDVVISPNQAGQKITCSCGKQISVPSMIQVRKLDVADDAKTATVSKPSRFRINEKWTVLAIGWVIFVPSLIFLVIVLLQKPTPVDVCFIDTKYTAGGNEIRRDQSPLQRRDTYLLVIWNSEEGKYRPLKAEHFELMSPFELIQLQKLLKRGPELSENFYEKYEGLWNFHYVRLAVGLVGLFVSSVLLILGFLVHRK